MIITFLLLALTTQLGVNLNGLSDYSPEIPFADAMKTARCFGTVATPYDCKYGEVIPAGEFGVLVHTGVSGLEGTYKLSFTGKADVFLLSSQGTIQNLKWDGTITTADVVLLKDSQLYLQFKNVIGTLTNISLLRPGLTKDQIFNPIFLNYLKSFSTLRLMDWLKTNSNPIKTWAERKTIDGLQTGAKGVALEYAAEIGNQTGKDIWVNVPIGADEDYIRNMAKLLKEKVKSSLNIYVEFSNEVWNTAPAFDQSLVNWNAAKVEVAAGAIDLQMGLPTDTNDWYWARRRVGKKTGIISDIFKEVFGADQMNKRIRIVLSGQAADMSKVRAALQYLEKYHGGKEGVSAAIYGIAIAPYFATKNQTLPAATVDTVLEGLQSSIASNKTAWIFRKDWDGKSQDVNHAEYAKYYGIKMIAYEGGVHQNGKTGEALNKAAMIHARMLPLYESYLRNWFETGGALFMQFSDIGNWNYNGYWGATYDYKVMTPKLQALLNVASDINKAAIDPKDAEIINLKAQLTLAQSNITQLQAQILEKDSKIQLCAGELMKSQGEMKTCSEAKTKLELIMSAIKALLN